MRHVKAEILHWILASIAAIACAPATVIADSTYPTFSPAMHAPRLAESTDVRWLEDTQIWQQPIAHQRTPRMQVKQLWDDDGAPFQDVTLGGVMPILDWRLNRTDFQFSISGAVFSRFESFGHLVAEDYLGVVQLSGQTVGLQWRLAFEHLSAHLGDEFLEAQPSRSRISYFRDEFVVGLSRPMTDKFRGYFQFGQAFNGHDSEEPTRFNGGFEWTPTTQLAYSIAVPYFAVDFELRSEQSYDPNATIQVGLIRTRPFSSRAIRMALEYYHGNSPFGQFFEEEEDLSLIHI